MKHVVELWYRTSGFIVRILAITNQKGGVGKTTTAISLGASLAANDLRVLLVDLDPQGNATSGLGVNKNNLGASIYDVLVEQTAPSAAVCSTEMDLLDLLPANRELIGATVELTTASNKEFRLKQALEDLRKGYDFVLIDCPPSLGILTVNALAAADSLLVPIQCEYFALEGLTELMNTIDRVRQGINPTLRIEGVLLTMYDDRLNLSGQIKESVQKHLGHQVFEVIIPRNVRLAEAPSFGKPILLYDRHSSGANSYSMLAREILERSPRPNFLKHLSGTKSQKKGRKS